MTKDRNQDLLVLLWLCLASAVVECPRGEFPVRDLHTVGRLTGCNLSRGCPDDTCGPFRITQPFWVDGGRHVIPGDDPDLYGAYRRCVMEPFCAADTIRGYYRRYAEVTSSAAHACHVTSRLHLLGPEYRSGGVPGAVARVMACYRG